MSDTSNDDRPPVGTPEFKEWLKKKSARHVEDIFSTGPADFDERGPLAGSSDLMDKSDAELFPDELEEYTPEERRKGFKVHEQQPSKDQLPIGKDEEE